MGARGHAGKGGLCLSGEETEVNQQTDSRLETWVEKYRIGDRAAGDELVHHLRSQFVARFMYAGLAAPEAEDLAQTCIVDVLKSVGRYDGARSGFETWASGIARNGLRNHYRRREVSRRFEVSSTAAEQTPAPDAENFETVKAIECALGSLSLLDQELLYMRFNQGMSFGEIAASSELTEANARKRVSRAVEHLRRSPDIQAIFC